MAEAIGLASGLLTLALFAFQSSVSLRQIVDSFQSNKKIIRELKYELEALSGVLQSLQQVAASNVGDLSGLNFPLFRCGKACKDFEEVIVKCTAHSSGNRTSFRDWAKLQYMGDDIAGFKDMLAGYKSTINIALADANFRTASVTSTVVKEYKALITNTTADLEDHLKEIDAKLEALSLSGSGVTSEDVVERERVEEEKESTKQCLNICALVSKHIEQVQSLAPQAASAAQNTPQAMATQLRGLVSAKEVTINALKECQERLTHTTLDLEKHLQAIESRQQILISGGPRVSDEVVIEREQVQEEKESIKQCLSICTEASKQVKDSRTTVFEDVCVGGDSHQIIVATLGDLIWAKRVTAGDRVDQWLGQMSDTSLQELARARVSGKPDGVARGNATEPKPENGANFEGSYGAGYKLK